MKTGLISLTGLLLANLLFAQGAVDSDQAVTVISKNAFRSHVRFLADDLLEGRGTASRGYRLAANYVAAQFEAAGLLPGVGDSSYFQVVPLRSYAPDKNRGDLVFYLRAKNKVWNLGEDFLPLGHPGSVEDSVRSGVVFVYFGISAPEYGYDNYADIDARGKIVAVIQGVPDKFSGDHRAYYNSWSVKRQTAIDHGAIGMLYLHTKEQNKRFSWERLVKFKYDAVTWLDDGGFPQDDVSPFKARAILNSTPADSLFSLAGFNPDSIMSGRYGSIELPVEASIRAYSKHEDITCRNVVAWLPGSDPDLKHEFVVYTAHLDHVGIGRPVDGDSIYNGAYDNASGISALIETARAFGHLKPRPRRSVMFVAVTAEEKGLVGSDYFITHPPVPAANIIANINLDMFLMLFPQNDVVAFGSEHSTLHETVLNAVGKIGMKLTPDPMPEENLFVRSDQYSFVKKGIPSVFLVSGVTSTDPEIDGLALNKEWLKTHYHQPTDDIDQPMDLDIAVRFCHVNFLIGYEVAQADEPPIWKEDDFFTIQFAKHQSR